jgi:hypothetical protein
LKIENYQLADIIFPYLHISIFPSPSGESYLLEMFVATPSLWREGWDGSWGGWDGA